MCRSGLHLRLAVVVVLVAVLVSVVVVVGGVGVYTDVRVSDITERRGWRRLAE